MLPTARVSLSRRIQSTLLSFSGSSVASGASTRESTSAETPSSSATVTTSSTKSSAPPTIINSPTTTWATIAIVRPTRRRRIRSEGDQHPDRPDDVEGCRVGQPQADADREAGQKEAEVATQRAVVGGPLRAAASPSAERQ